MAKGEFLSKEDILKQEDLKYVEVDCPEWGGKVRLKTMTGLERDSFEASLFDGKAGSEKTNLKNLRAKLLAICLVNGEGKRLFGDREIDALGGKSAKALDKLYTIASELNAIGAKDVDELTKN